MGRSPGVWNPGSVLDALEQDYVLSPRWRNARFAWLKRVLPAQKGRVGERLFWQLCEQAGLGAAPRSGSAHDCRVEGLRVEVKLSTAYDTPADVTPYMQWLQIRPGGAFDTVAFIGVCPDHVHCWVTSKAVAVAHSTGQHTGKTATETMQLHIPDPHNPPEFLGPDISESPAVFRRRIREIRDTVERSSVT